MHKIIKVKVIQGQRSNYIFWPYFNIYWLYDPLVHKISQDQCQGHPRSLKVKCQICNFDPNCNIYCLYDPLVHQIGQGQGHPIEWLDCMSRNIDHIEWLWAAEGYYVLPTRSCYLYVIGRVISVVDCRCAKLWWSLTLNMLHMIAEKQTTFLDVICFW